MTKSEFMVIENPSDYVDFCYENKLENYADDFIHTDDLDEFVARRVQSGGWQGVACMLNRVDWFDDEYYHIDGYGNIENVNPNILDAYKSDILREFGDTELFDDYYEADC